MKKILIFFICLAMLILSGCSQDRESREAQELLKEYIEGSLAYDDTVRQFGEPLTYISMEKSLSVAILYPDTDYSFINKKLSKWMENITQVYETAAEQESSQSSELFITYRSYLAGSSIAGIRMEGSYFSPQMAHPEYISETFVADLEKKRFLSVNDIIKENSLNVFENMVVSRGGVMPEDADDRILRHALITDKGVDIILNRGEYLPMSEGTKTVSFTFQELEKFLAESVAGRVFSETDSSQQATEQTTVTTSRVRVPAEKPAVDKNKPMLAITFDDGPGAHTKELVEILNKHQARATFFVLGNIIDSRKSTLEEIYESGHEIGSHSWNHRSFENLSKEEIKNQIMTTRAKIYEITGSDCLIVRPPYGAINDVVQQAGKETGVWFVNWTVDTYDWKTKDAEAVEKEILEYAFDGAIILCHDLHETTVEAIDKAVPQLLEQGYQLVTVSELLENSRVKPEAGGVYYKQ